MSVLVIHVRMEPRVMTISTATAAHVYLVLLERIVRRVSFIYNVNRFTCSCVPLPFRLGRLLVLDLYKGLIPLKPVSFLLHSFCG